MRETVELGQLDPLRDFCFCTDGVRGHLTVAAHGIPGDVYVYGQGEQHLDGATGPTLILRVGRGAAATGRRLARSSRRPTRFRPGASEVMALRVGYEKLNRETGWEPHVSWEDGVAQTIAWYAENRDRAGSAASTGTRQTRAPAVKIARDGRRRLPRLASRRAPRRPTATRSSSRVAPRST